MFYFDNGFNISIRSVTVHSMQKFFFRDWKKQLVVAQISVWSMPIVLPYAIKSNFSFSLVRRLSVVCTSFQISLHLLPEVLFKTTCTYIPCADYSSLKRKRKKLDSSVWQNPLHPQKYPKKQHENSKRHQKLRLHNDCGST